MKIERPKIERFKIEPLPFVVTSNHPAIARLLVMCNYWRLLKFMKITPTIYCYKYKEHISAKPIYRLFLPKIRYVKDDAL